MKTTTLVRVLWYNAAASIYQSGTWKDFNRLIASVRNPHDIQPLERFNDATESTLQKIVSELNKCSPRHSR